MRKNDQGPALFLKANRKGVFRAMLFNTASLYQIMAILANMLLKRRYF